MRSDNRFLSITLLMLMFTMGILNLFGQKRGFATVVKQAVERVQKEADKDPDTFKDNMQRLEKELGGRKSPVERSVADAMLASAYQEMKWTNITDFDEETRDAYDAKCNEHFSHVLDNMEALAAEKATGWEVLLDKGKDSDLYGNDLLSVMIAFVEENARLKVEERASIYERAIKVYQQRGNLNGYGLMKAKWLDVMQEVENVEGRLSYKQYKESLYQLILEVKTEEVGADLALKYSEHNLGRDDAILFRKWAVENLGKSRSMNNLKNALEGQLRPTISMYGGGSVLANRSFQISLSFWNCERTTLTIRKYVGREMTKDGPGALLLTGEVVDKKEVVLEIDSTNAERKAKGLPVEGTTKVNINLPPGRYVYVAEGAGDLVANEAHVTSMRLVELEKAHKISQIYVVDNETGRPVSGVKVQFRSELPKAVDRTFGWENRGIEAERVTGADGMVEMEATAYMRAVKDENDYTPWDRYYVSRKNIPSHNGHFSYQVMTDRSIYRPGQTVQGSLVLYHQEGDKVQMVPEADVKLVVQDAKWRKLTTIDLLTNEFGTASFSIPLPQDCEVGVLHLEFQENEKSVYTETVRVEEYKRPTFDVQFGGNRSGHFGEVLEVEGTAMMFAGVPVQGAQVHYTVEYASVDFKRWFWNYRWTSMSEGDLITDDEGKFRVPVTLTDEHLQSDYAAARFRVKATVTDVGGETHEAQWTVNASNREFGLDLTVASVVDMAKEPFFKVDAYDINHEKVTVKGKYKITQAYEPLYEGNFTTGDSILLPADLKLGAHYRIEVKALESNGNEVVDNAYFDTFNSALPVTEVDSWGIGEKKRAADKVEEQDFLYTPSRTFAVGESVDLFFTTQETDAYIIYNVYNMEGLIEHHVGVTDGAMKHLRLLYREEWGEGIEVDIVYVRNGRFSALSEHFQLKRPEKRLKLEWATFRDKLQPGQQEQWTLTVTDKDGKRVSGAEMMAVLYDASLDRIYSHYWGFGLQFERFVPRYAQSSSNFTKFPSYSLAGKLRYLTSYERTFTQFMGYEHDRYIQYSRAAGRGGRVLYRDMVEDAVPLMSSMKANVAAEEVADDGLEVETAAENEEPAVPQEDFENATVRENFEETAFFLPHLVSDAKGDVRIQFTLPESLTEWQFMGFAHTKDVDYGSIRATAVARKSFMLRPNMPRFLRWGDKAVVASSIINQSEEGLKGAVRMRLLNPKTGEVVLAQEKAFEVEAGKTVGVDFDFDVLENWQDLDCELIAMSGNVSDGEKNHLPILSTKKMMVESVPYYIAGNADGSEVSKVMDLNQLYNQNSKTAVKRMLQVEYTDNPAWMCIEALRSVKNPVEDDAFDYAASLYANSRLLDLMRTFPVLEREESVSDLQARVSMAQTKLAALQKEDGGWSWFLGMQSNLYTTMSVCEQLAKMPNPNDAVKRMLEDGMKYLDRLKVDSYKYNKSKKNKIWPSESDIRYLYISAQIPQREVSKDVVTMREEYLSKMEKDYKNLTIYGVANAAYTLRAFNHVKAADRFVDFLKDYTVEKPGQGRFYATDAAYYSWMDYRIPTQIAAMKAIYQKDKKDGYLNDMQLWLLTQKQVQKWDNPMNTIEVTDFLLKVSPMETFHEAKNPVMVVDGNVLENLDYGTINTERDSLEGRSANLVLQGNVLANVPEAMLHDGARQLVVKKQTPGISWGAAYATFLEDVGNLKLYATNELKIQRKFYVQSAGSDKWVDYDINQPLKVGDKLRIRHIITADRDMDFVRVSAQYPACLEPLRHLSGYQRMGGRGCYLSIHDAHFDMFFDWFTRGTSTLDMDYSIVRAGCYEVGVSTVECVYAKQFGGHTEGMKVEVGRK